MNTNSWLLDSANSGNPEAMSILGTMCLRGQGQPIDSDKALYWYTLAIEHGDKGAMYSLGRMYFIGEGVKQDYAEALKWFTQGANCNEPQSYFQLGYMYCRGLGVKQNIETAIQWYTKAANTGNQSAIHNLGILLSKTQKPQTSFPIMKRSSAIIVGLAIIIGLLKYAGLGVAILTLVGCQPASVKTIPVVIAPDSPTPTINNIKGATTQIGAHVDEATNNIAKSNILLNTTTNKISVDANAGKAATPIQLTQVIAYWNDVLVQAGILSSVKATNDKAVQQLVDQKVQIDALSSQLDVANTAAKATTDFWVKEDATNKKNIKDVQTKLDKANSDTQKALNDKLIWVILGSIVLIGASVAIGTMLTLPLITRGGVIAFGTTLGVAVLLCQTMWIVKWVAIGLVVIMFVVIIWQIISHRNAISALVQTKQAHLQLLSPQAKTFLYGHGAFKGAITDDEKPAVKFLKHFGLSVRRADTTPAPGGLTPSPLGGTLPII